MAEPEKVSIDPGATAQNGSKPNSAADRLRAKAKELKGPRGKYRCRKCRELPCVCVDPKQSRSAGPSESAPLSLAPQEPIFTERRTARILEVGFGIPAIITHCQLWALTEEEAEDLAKPASDVLNEFVAIDPKWVSLTVLAAAMGSIVARKTVQYTAWKRAMALRRDEQPATPDPAPQQPPPPEPEVPHVSNGGRPVPGPSMSIDLLR